MPFVWSHPQHKTNPNSPLVGQCACRLKRAKSAPLGKGDLTVGLKIVPWAETAFLIEMVVDGRMDGYEFPQTSHLPGAQHDPLVKEVFF